MARFANPSTWGRPRQPKQPTLDTSTASLNQSSSSYQYNNGYGHPSSSSSSYNHPYASNPPAPLPVVSHDSPDDDESCPVCLESLAFSFRLPGEKPHIVPECGHALHEACFVTVYGPVPTAKGGAGGAPRKSHIGVCGVCRRPMKVGDGDGGKSNKLAALTGMGPGDDARSPPTPYTPSGATSMPGVIVGPNRPPTSASMASRMPNGHTPIQSNVVVLGGNSYNGPKSAISGNSSPGANALIDAHPTGASTPLSGLNVQHKAFDPTEDDPIEHAHSVRSSGSNSGGDSAYVVAPSIQVRSEFPSITQPSGETRTQPLTCIVVVELPARRANSAPTPSSNEPSYGMNGYGGHHGNGHGHPHGGHSASPSVAGTVNTNHGMGSGSMRTAHTHITEEDDPGYGTVTTHNRGGSGNTVTRSRSASQSETKPSPLVRDLDAPNPAFAGVAADLQARIADWKGHPMSGLGALQMFDILSVRRDALVREFYVYLFKEAIICVLEDKKKNALGRALNGNGILNGSDTSSATSSTATNSKPLLRLKGRIYIRHVKRVHDTSAEDEMSLTIDMEDERLESFILIFKDRTTLEGWRTIISGLVDALKDPGASLNRTKSRERLLANGVNQTLSGRRSPGPPPVAPSHQQAALLNEMEEFGGKGRNSSTPTTGSGYTEEEKRNTVSTVPTSASSYYAKNVIGDYSHTQAQHLRDVHSPTPTPGPPTPTPMPHMTTSQPSNSLPPLPHTPMDLILVVSLPPPSASPSTAALKLRVIKNTLDFVVGSLGGRDRLSLVTFEVGVGGKVRKTPFLRIGRGIGRERLGRFIDFMGVSTRGTSAAEEQEDEMEDEFSARTGKDEKTDVVTGVNHALDNVLQRKSKNPISSMLLVSDASDSTRRAQMDLVLARAEAANLPIHSFGYGRSHDPASLWLMSNHTNGTYTFVKDWYDLRPCLAGCIGGLMSIGLVNMKLHMKILDSQRFKIRKVSGGPHAIVSTDGRDVDVDIGEIRYGEKKEMLVELELDHWLANRANGGRDGHSRTNNATDEFVARMGLDAMSIGDDASPNLVDGMMDRMIDEVPVFEVDGSFYDPATSKHVSRLAHPVLLTVTLLPPVPNSRDGSPPDKPSDPVIVRRRMELLASDMITRALVLISRKNYEQALKIMAETRRILNTVLQAIGSNLASIGGGGSMRSRKELLTLSAIRALQAVLQDIQILTDAMDDNVEMFAHDHRNLGAQQAMILRDQKSWSGRTAIEKLFWTTDSSIDLVQRSNDWVSIRE